MSHQHNAEQLEIQQLRALLQQKDAAHREVLRCKEEDLFRARQQLSHLQSSVYQSQLSQPSTPSILDVSAVHNEFQLSNTVPAAPISQHGLSRSRTVPRSSGGAAHGRHEAAPPSTNRHSNNMHAVKRVRTMSQQTPASQRMDRVGSNLSTKSAGPFSGNTPITPPPKFQNAHPQAPNGGMMDHTDREESVNPYAFVHPVRPSQSGRHRHDMPTLAEIGPGPTTGQLLDPAVWLASNPFPEEPCPPTGSFGSSAPAQHHDPDVPQFNVTSVSVCGSMTTSPTYDTPPMTRQNSLLDNQSVSGGVRMMNLGSHMSQGADSYYRESSQQNAGSSGENSPLGKRPYPCEDALLAVGSSLAPPLRHQYASSSPIEDGLYASSDMERSISSASMASNRSTSSLKARAKDTLKQQNQRAMNAPLKPKPTVERAAAEAQATTKKDGKAVIAKTKYVRPKQPKVFCDQCDEHKDGFRGEHELRRHKDAKHQSQVKKWICVDPAANGLPIGVPVVNPLTKCKACNFKKRYGAYYNAAAHLRRTHFKEKPSRQKNKGAGNARGDDERRGGKGGGDWPPMSELKNWMKEIWVNKSEQRQDEDDDGDEDLDQPMDVDPDFGDCILPDFGGSQRFPLANMDYTFPNNLAVNADGTYMQGMPGMPISSADFNFNTSPTMSPHFSPDMAYASQEQMTQYSSALSSSATVTPMTAYNDPSQLDDIQFEMVYTQ